MAEGSHNDIEPQGTPQTLQQSNSAKEKGVYSNLTRQLTEDDLNSPGAQRLILAELDKYDECKKDLNYYKEQYHRKDKENAVYRQLVTSTRAFDIIYSTLLAIGPALLGLSTYFFTNKDVLGGIIMICIGVICLIAGICTKIFVKPSKMSPDDEY